MRIRIGYGGPRKYRHGQYFPGGRRNNGNMTEIERLIHLIASMQILFGSRRGGAIIPLLVIAAAIGGWFIYRTQYSPEKALEKAHAMWESNDTKQQIAAIKSYKKLLAKSDPIEPGRHWLMDDRDTLYRRIIRHEFMFEENTTKAHGWITKAWDEGFRDLRFQEADTELREFWTKTTDKWRQKNRSKENSRQQKSKDRGGKFDRIPGIDSNGGLSPPVDFSFA